MQHIWDPLQRLAVDSHQIEAAGGLIGTTHQVMLGGSPKPLLLDGADTGRCTAVARAAALPNFDKYYQPCVPHDQIDLAETASIVTHDQAQTLSLQVRQRPVFCLLAQRDGHRGRCQTVLYNALMTGK